MYLGERRMLVSLAFVTAVTISRTALLAHTASVSGLARTTKITKYPLFAACASYRPSLNTPLWRQWCATPTSPRRDDALATPLSSLAESLKLAPTALFPPSAWLTSRSTTSSSRTEPASGQHLGWCATARRRRTSPDPGIVIALCAIPFSHPSPKLDKQRMGRQTHPKPSVQTCFTIYTRSPYMFSCVSIFLMFLLLHSHMMYAESIRLFLTPRSGKIPRVSLSHQPQLVAVHSTT